MLSTTQTDMSLLSSDNEPDIAGRAARSGAAMFIAKAFRFGFLLIVNIILINLLLPAHFGMMRYVMLVVGIAGLLNEMGLTTAIVQKEHLEREYLWSLFCISSLWGVGLYGTIFFMAPIISRYFAVPELTPMLRVGAIIIPAGGVSAVQRAILRRNMEYGKLALIEITAAGVSAVVSVAMAISDFGVWALVTGYLSFEAVISIAVFFICRIGVFPLKPFGALRPFIFFGIAIVISRITDYIVFNMPFFLIGKWIGKEGLGLFSVARDLAVFPQAAINAILANVILSAFSRIQNDDEKTASGFSSLLIFGSVLTLPLLLIMGIMPKQLLQVICILKNESVWIEATPFLRWLSLMGITYVFTTFPNSVWLARGKVIESIAVSAAGACVIVFAVATGKRWGLDGICIALFLQEIAVFFPYVFVNYLLTNIPVALFLSSLVPSVVAGAGMAAVLFLTQLLIPKDLPGRHLVVLITGCFAGITAYTIILFLFFRSSLHKVRRMMIMAIPYLRRKD